MREEFYNLYPKSVAGGGAGAISTPQNASDLFDKWVQIGEAAAGAINATVQVEVSLDGVNWAVVGAPLVNMGGIIQVPVAAKKIRVNTTAWVSGVLVATLSGYLTRDR